MFGYFTIFFFDFLFPCSKRATFALLWGFACASEAITIIVNKLLMVLNDFEVRIIDLNLKIIVFDLNNENLSCNGQACHRWHHS